ncbi:ABC transporter permease [Sphingorhabdus sp. EL138]|uniref:ABC transporter permease n=1 Tax=Sphingorhabdus sp. EL138 TaxID=2073156 RepID=UPI0025DDA328|nr:ABC transporter permease [Sphingorhabdus sp. EL138]
MASNPSLNDTKLGGSSINVQVRVIYALLVRELLTRYGRNNVGFVWLILEPMLFTLTITAIWTATQSIHGSDLPIVAFAVTGYSAMMMWRNMPGRCIGALTSNKPLLFHRQVRPLDVYVARNFLEFIGSSVAFIFLITAFWSVDWMKLPEDALQVLGGWLMLAWFGMGLALLLGAISERSELVEKLWSPMSYLLFPFSGAAFIADSLPERVREVLLYLPMLNCVEFIREGYFGSMMKAHYDMAYVAIFNLCLTFVALVLVRGLNVEADYE